MAAPVKLNFKMYQGSTFTEVIRWESSTKVYAPITNVSKAAPMVVAAVGHGMPAGWRAKITNVVGMKEVNSDNYLTATAVTSDSVTFNAVNSLGYTTYTSGGVLEYNQPVPLVGLTARMQIREKASSIEVLQELTTENSFILINTSNSTITITLPATTTAAFVFKSAVYSIEIIDGSAVTPLAYGSIVLDTEITR